MTFAETWIFTPLKNFQNWLYGDTLSPTFETRKTVFETILAGLGFLVINRVVNRLELF